MNDVYERVLLDAIRECLVNERFYRANRWATWSDLRRENRAALSALLKVARMARRAQRKADEARENRWQWYIERAAYGPGAFR